MRAAQETSDQLLATLVGTTKKAQAFELGLRTFMQSTADRIPTPYDRLETGVAHIAYSVAFPRNFETMSTRQLHAWASMQRNWMVGPKIAIAGLKTIGDIYKAQADTAQQALRVQRTASHIMRYIHTGAFSNDDKGPLNMVALRYGLEPNNPYLLDYVDDGEDLKCIEMSSDAFNVTSDEEGQLDIDPRYPLLRAKKTCPAVHFRTEVPEQTYGRSGLLTFLETIGQVAATEIYPAQFDMTNTIALGPYMNLPQ